MSARTDEIDSGVLGLIGEGIFGRLSPEYLCERSGLDVGAVKKSLARLVKRKVVKRTGHPRWGFYYTATKKKQGQTTQSPQPVAVQLPQEPDNNSWIQPVEGSL